MHCQNTKQLYNCMKCSIKALATFNDHLSLQTLLLWVWQQIPDCNCVLLQATSDGAKLGVVKARQYLGHFTCKPRPGHVQGFRLYLEFAAACCRPPQTAPNSALSRTDSTLASSPVSLGQAMDRVPSPSKAEAAAFVSRHSPDPSDLLPGLCLLTERWLQRVRCSSLSCCSLCITKLLLAASVCAAWNLDKFGSVSRLSASDSCLFANKHLSICSLLSKGLLAPCIVLQVTACIPSCNMQYCDELASSQNTEAIAYLTWLSSDATTQPRFFSQCISCVLGGQIMHDAKGLIGHVSHFIEAQSDTDSCCAY